MQLLRMLFLYLTMNRVADNCVNDGATNSYYAYLISNLVVLLAAGSLFSVLSQAIAQSASAAILIASSLPTVALFFMNYIITTWLATTSLHLLKHLRAISYIMLRIRFLANPMGLTRNTLLKGPLAPTTIKYGAVLPNTLYALTIVLLFWVIAPLVLPLSAGMFWSQYIVYKYKYLFMVQAPFDYGGRFWYDLYFYSMAALLASSCAFIAYMGLKQGVVQTPLLLPLPIIIIYCWRFTERKFKAYSLDIPFQDAVKESTGIEEGPNGKEGEEVEEDEEVWSNKAPISESSGGANEVEIVAWNKSDPSYSAGELDPKRQIYSTEEPTDGASLNGKHRDMMSNNEGGVRARNQTALDFKALPIAPDSDMNSNTMLCTNYSGDTLPNGAKVSLQRSLSKQAYSITSLLVQFHADFYTQPNLVKPAQVYPYPHRINDTPLLTNDGGMHELYHRHATAAAVLAYAQQLAEADAASERAAEAFFVAHKGDDALHELEECTSLGWHSNSTRAKPRHGCELHGMRNNLTTSSTTTSTAIASPSADRPGGVENDESSPLRESTRGSSRRWLVPGPESGKWRVERKVHACIDAHEPLAAEFPPARAGENMRNSLRAATVRLPRDPSGRACPVVFGDATPASAAETVETAEAITMGSRRDCSARGSAAQSVDRGLTSGRSSQADSILPSDSTLVDSSSDGTLRTAHSSHGNIIIIKSQHDQLYISEQDRLNPFLGDDFAEENSPAPYQPQPLLTLPQRLILQEPSPPTTQERPRPRLPSSLSVMSSSADLENRATGPASELETPAITAIELESETTGLEITHAKPDFNSAADDVTHLAGTAEAASHQSHPRSESGSRSGSAETPHLAGPYSFPFSPPSNPSFTSAHAYLPSDVPHNRAMDGGHGLPHSSRERWTPAQSYFHSPSTDYGGTSLSRLPLESSSASARIMQQQHRPSSGSTTSSSAMGGPSHTPAPSLLGANLATFMGSQSTGESRIEVTNSHRAEETDAEDTLTPSTEEENGRASLAKVFTDTQLAVEETEHIPTSSTEEEADPAAEDDGAVELADTQPAVEETEHIPTSSTEEEADPAAEDDDAVELADTQPALAGD